jgi:hypothetical protein
MSTSDLVLLVTCTVTMKMAQGTDGDYWVAASIGVLHVYSAGRRTRRPDALVRSGQLAGTRQGRALSRTPHPCRCALIG